MLPHYSEEPAMPAETVIRPRVPAVLPSALFGGVARPAPCTILICGATGDLPARKLLPALFGLWRGGFLPRDLAVVGVARRDKSDDEFRKEVREAIRKFRKDGQTADGWDEFLGRVFYHRADFTSDAGLRTLAERLPQLERERGLPGNRLFYLAVDPQF